VRLSCFFIFLGLLVRSESDSPFLDKAAKPPWKKVLQQPMSYCRRNRLRKGKRGITSSYGYNPRAAYRPIYNKHRRRTPEWGALHRAWVGYVIAKSQDDYEKMRKYAIVIRKFQRRLNIAISDFYDIGVYGLEENFKDKEEDDDSNSI